MNIALLFCCRLYFIDTKKIKCCYIMTFWIFLSLLLLVVRLSLTIFITDHSIHGIICKNQSPRECEMYLFVRTDYPGDFSLLSTQKVLKTLCLPYTNNYDIAIPDICIIETTHDSQSGLRCGDIC